MADQQRNQFSSKNPTQPPVFGLDSVEIADAQGPSNLETGLFQFTGQMIDNRLL
jgi:hypothetical protein